MTPLSVRAELAAALAPHFMAGLDGLAVLALSGSTARATVDDLSDLEVLAVYPTLPPRPARDALITTLKAEVVRQFEHPSGTMAVDNLLLEGFQVDVIHETTRAVHARIEGVAEVEDTTLRTQSIVANLPRARAFIGAPQLAAWQRRLVYTPHYQAKVIRENLSIRSPSGAQTHLRRGDLLRFYQLLLSWQETICVVVCALNRRFYPGPKHTRQVLASLPIAPPDLDARLRQAQTASPPQALALTVGLLHEVVGLVELHHPAIDTRPIRKRLASTPRPGWAPPAIARIIAALQSG